MGAQRGGRFSPGLQGPARTPSGGVLGGMGCDRAGPGALLSPAGGGQGGTAALSSAAQARAGRQADPDVSIWGPLLAPLSLAGQRVGPRHSCGWEPMLEANGAAAAADATADAARPLHTHLPLSPPPASKRAGGGPRAAAGRAAWGDGGQGRHSGQWGLAGGEGRVEAGRDAAATAVMWGVRGAGRMAGGRGT